MNKFLVLRPVPRLSIDITRDRPSQRDVASHPTLYDTPSPMGYVDLHSHVLFALDDGAPDLGTALAMLDALSTLGVSEQCVTPHQRSPQYLPSATAIEAALAELENQRKATHPALRLGAENMWDDVFYERAASATIPGYRGTRAFLVEIPPALLPPRMADRLFEFMRAGTLPVLAHPERYHALWQDDELARSLARVCAFVVDLPAVAGFHGKQEAKQARRLIELGLAHAVATDAHNLADVQRAAAGLHWIEKKLGHAGVVRLFDHAPRMILNGELPD